MTVLVLLFAIALTGCDEEDSTLVTSVGTIGFVVTDPALASQVVNAGEPELTIQNVVWTLSAPAELTDDAGDKQDLLFGEPCVFVQTTKSSFNPEGRCSGGIILGSTDDFGATEPSGVDVTLALHLDSMVVRRAKPLVLPVGGDYDTDGVINLADNCPLMPNPDQADGNLDGVGDSCTVRDFFGADVPDNDGDGVADGSDNCVWYQNPLQEDTKGVAAIYGIPDGIGDACVEQIAYITDGVPAELSDTFDLSLATGGISFVTVDFDDERTLTDLNWESQSGKLLAEAVAGCGVRSDFNLALSGCDGTTEGGRGIRRSR